jgi:hypothetical protein
MAGRAPIDYTSRDEIAISEDMKRGIPFYCPEWTFHGPSDPGICQVELTADQLSKLHYYIDRAKKEGFWGTALQRSSLIALGKIIGYELRGSVPASVDLKFFIATPATSKVLIPAGTKVQTKGGGAAGESPVKFETAEDAEIDIGETEVVVGAFQGETFTEDLGLSTGIASQRYTLARTGIIDDSQELWVDEGLGYALWAEVQSFAVADNDDKVYTVGRTDEEGMTIFLGDNVQGAIPPPGAAIRAKYRVGGGLSSNVGAGTITVVTDAIYNEALEAVPIQVINEEDASGGEDPISIEEARRMGPLYARTNETAVTLEDYETLAENYPGVATASAEEIFSACACGCGVRVTIMPTGGGVPSSILLESLKEYLLERSVMGRDCLEVVGADNVGVCVKGTVYVGLNYRLDDGENNVEVALDEYFDPVGEFVKPGVGVKESDFFAKIDGAEGVDHVDIEELTLCPTPVYGLWNGDPTKVVDPDTGLTEAARFDSIELGMCAIPEVWTIVGTGTDTFSVTGSVSGLQTNVGHVGVEYETDDGQIKFTILAGQNPLRPGDTASFRVTWKKGNVDIEANEVFVRGTVELTFVGGARAVSPCT